MIGPEGDGWDFGVWHAVVVVLISSFIILTLAPLSFYYLTMVLVDTVKGLILWN